MLFIKYLFIQKKQLRVLYRGIKDSTRIYLLSRIEEFNLKVN